jgi:hypothetical protein
MRCPSCTSRMGWEHVRHWYSCELCSTKVTGEYLGRKRKSRLGRLWIWRHT